MSMGVPRCSLRSGDLEPKALDHVAHEAPAVPIRLGRLDLALRIGAAQLQAQRSRCRRRYLRALLAKAVAALVAPERGPLPALSAIDRQLHLRDAAIAAEGDASYRQSRSGLDGPGLRHVCQEGARHP